MKKLLGVLLALVIAVAMPVSAYGAWWQAYWDTWEQWYAWAHGYVDDDGNDLLNRENTGIWGLGGFSRSTPAYRLGAESESEITFDGVLERDPDWAYVLAGSTIFIPLAVEDAAGALSIATDRQVRDDRVTISYMVAQGERYVESVELVDTRRERINGLEAGMHVRINYTPQTRSLAPVNVIVNISLNVNRVSQPDTEVEVGVNLVNHDVVIDRSTIFGAHIPTAFRAASDFSGEATFDLGGGVRYTGLVSSSQRYLIAYTTEPILDIEEAHPDAHLVFHRFLGGQASFAGPGLLQIPVNLSDFEDGDGNPHLFVYEIRHGSYNLVPISNGISLDRRAGVLTVQTNRLTEWVLSSQALERVVLYDGHGILQTGHADEDTAEVPAQELTMGTLEVPVAPPAPPDTGIQVQNLGATHNPPTGTRAGAIPLEGAVAIAVAAFVVAAWAAAKKIRQWLGLHK